MPGNAKRWKEAAKRRRFYADLDARTIKNFGEAIRRRDALIGTLVAKTGEVSTLREEATRTLSPKLQAGCPNPHCKDGFIRGTLVGCAVCSGGA